VSLLDPVVRRILEQTNAAFLRDGGTIRHVTGEDRDGGAYAHWELSWPEQRHASARHGGRVEPVQVIAVFGRGNTHPHLQAAEDEFPVVILGDLLARRPRQPGPSPCLFHVAFRAESRATSRRRRPAEPGDALPLADPGTLLAWNRAGSGCPGTA
jgi:hypothetical protein